MSTIINTDIVIIGAGIAGLWLHHRLNDLGYHATLVENQEIGGGQTLSSQGIIHGGAKYTLNGILGSEANAIAGMPKRWLDCLDGSGEIDLSNTRLLSRNQLMWSTQSLSSKLTSFFSSKALNGKIAPLKKDQHPEFFKQAAFKGNLYQLNEPVLDVPSLIDVLSTKWRNRMICHPEKYQWIKDNTGKIEAIEWPTATIRAQAFLLTSGEGIGSLLEDLGIETPKMQLRPLQMVLAKGKLPLLYAHCVGASTKPIATISTHKHSDGDQVWYLGGNIAEQGVDDDSPQLIKKTKETLKNLLPWVNIDSLQWATHRVNRAEPAQKNLLKPDTAFLAREHNLYIGWPTKLALTPDLSDRALQALGEQNLEKSSESEQTISDQNIAALGEGFKAIVSENLWERSIYAND